MTDLSGIDAAGIMASNGWLAHLPEGFKREVLTRAILQRFSAREVIYRFGDPPGGIYGLVSGTVTVNTAPSTKVPRLVHLGVPGTWTGEGGFLSRQPRRLELRSVNDTLLMHLPLDTLDEMASRNPEVVRYVSLILMTTVDVMIHVIHDLQIRDTNRRIASVLARANWIGGNNVPLSQTDLGLMANASRKQVNAALQYFGKAGWITAGYRAIEVIDAQSLREFAAEPDTL
ncbi:MULTISPECIES: Crp/Fnr family transcriptional regulator [Pandoraea]|uniref:Crp/Fnr family transcriptional regulator n=1 Tax=Pandoraea TaxID=93217 RepID=UPI001F5D7B27|nr:MULTISPECIES: Crp/Fnr family transcriptional regulator [Pandoraea]MCI3206375.1 Crp/Fnr family transcriptional regulator [Pandoraea sp. LA3]MDN4584403.1 Crp/Fnr family transcriptional regulator [Pandoraea capi]